MKKKISSKYYILLILIFVIVLISIFLLINFHQHPQESDIIKYKSYLIKIESSDYNHDTRCGRIDITVKNSKKLFASEDDVLNNGNMKIVDLDYGLRVQRDGIQAKSYIQELKYEKNVQHILIKYINIAEKPQNNHAQIQIMKFPNATLDKEFKTPVEKESDSIVLSAGKGKGAIVVSSHGMFIDNEGTDTLHVFDITVNYKDGKKNTLFLSNEYNVNEKKTNYAQVLHEDENLQKYYYYWDFGDLENIKNIKVNDTLYSPLSF